MTLTDHPSTDTAEAPAASTDGADEAPQPAAPPTIVVRPWHDPVLAQRGHTPRSEYVERFWLGVIGPSAVMLLRRLARGLDEHPNGFSIALPDTARAIGLGGGTGRSSPVNRTIDRCCMFGVMRRLDDGSIAVRTHLPGLNARQLARLPLAVRTSHDAWLGMPSAA